MKRFTIRFMLLLCALVVGTSMSWADDVTYQFTSKSWASDNGNWTSGADGGQLASGQGVQVTTTYTGANATSPESLSNISKVVVRYCTNAKNGTGAIKIQIGTGTEQSFTVTKPSSDGTTLKDATFNYDTPETGKVKLTVDCTQNSIYIYSVTVTYSPAPSYTITAQSNNDDWGTVNLVGSVITAEPADGYTYASPAYTVSSGTATVEQNGNEFTVTPSSNCTVTINFMLLPAYTVTLGDDNSTLEETSPGAGVTLPSRSNIGDYIFAGWSTTKITTETTDEPVINVAGEYHPTANVTLHPVYTRTEVGGDETLVETMSYGSDNWNISSDNTFAASGYTVFGDGGYVESTNTFDLSALSKVVVKARTYGGTSYEYFNVGTATDVWAEGDATGGSTMKDYTLEGTASLTGIAKIRVTSASGDGSSNGVGIQKVEIYISATTYYTSGYTMSISKWTSTTSNDGWYLIAAPVGTTAAAGIGNLVSSNGTAYATNAYDLYRFNQAAEDEWENWKQTGGHYQFDLEPGMGYLYANSNDVKLTFFDQSTSTETTYDVTLTYSDENANTDMHGWNLIGNPFATTATIKDSDNNAKPFYRMNEDHTDLITETITGDVNALEGIFVHTDSGEDVTFTKTGSKSAAASNVNYIVIDLSGEKGTVIDRAIVRFDEGETLPKFQLKDNSTKLCIAQDGKEYAIVNAEAQGEMPVSFRANENGQYTLTVNAEGVEMNYLHLVDNMTGTDIDLLQTPSYTFDATPSDFTSRFRLVFSASAVAENEESDQPFAFFSNGSWIVNNEGEATLQVVDMTGRLVSSESVNGTVSTIINATPGVYMLRLINGGDVRMQKVVVR